MHANSHGCGGARGEARHQNVYRGAQPAGADKDNEADGRDSNAHIFFDEGNG